MINLVRFQFLRRVILRVEMVVHKSIDYLSFANEAWTNDADAHSLCLGVGIFATFWFLSHDWSNSVLAERLIVKYTNNYLFISYKESIR